MHISGHKLPDECYGIGAEALVAVWLALEKSQREAGQIKDAGHTAIMRRQMQEALNLVKKP